MKTNTIKRRWIGLKWNETKESEIMIKFILFFDFCGHWVNQKKIVSMTISVNKISVKTIFVKTISVKITFLRADRETTKFWMHVMAIDWNGVVRYDTVWYGIVWYGMRSKSEMWMRKRWKRTFVCDKGRGEGVCVVVMMMSRRRGGGGRKGVNVWLCVVRIWEEGRKKWSERLTFSY